MKFYEAPFYNDEDLYRLDESEIHFPFSDKNAKYIGKDHQYELTSQYFEERGVNLEVELEGNSPDKVKNFLRDLRRKVYTYIYNHNKSTKRQMDYLIAKKALRGYSKFEYRQMFLEAMFIEGTYLLANGDISNVTGVDLDIMQNMSEDVMRNQNRDFHKDTIELFKTLGLSFLGRYNFIPQGEDW